MPTPNVLGYVVESSENKDVEEENGELVVKNHTLRLRLKLKNTLGATREIWVDAPVDLTDFFAAAIPSSD